MTLADVQVKPAQTVTWPFLPRRKLFTAAECQHMLRAGILSEDDRLELIEGDLVKMPPISAKHAGCVKRLAALFYDTLRKRAVVSVQDPVHLGEHSEPQPDLALLRPRADYYTQAHPTPQDVLLVVEVSETSTDYDRDIKMPLYARAGIGEAWLVLLEEGWIEVYSEPSPAGYLATRRILPGASLAPQAFPEAVLAAGDVIAQSEE